MNKISERISAKIANAGFIAALLVVFIHIDIQSHCPAFVSCFVKVVKTLICSVAVPTFFLISGYLLTGRVDESGWWIRSMRKRIVTLGIPYLIWGSLFFCFDYFRSHDASFFGLLNSLGLTTCDMPGLYPLWFIRSLFVLVGISPLLVLLLSRFGVKLIGILFAITLIGPGVSDVDLFVVRFANGVMSIFGGLFYFSTGVYLRIRESETKLSSVFNRIFLAIGFTLALIALMCELDGSFLLSRYLCIFSVPLLMFGLWDILPYIRLPMWLSRCAFPVFIMHVFAIGFYNNFLVREVNTLTGFGLKYVFAFAMPILFVCIARRFAPRLTSIAFGGRC